MEDNQIVQLYLHRNEQALAENVRYEKDNSHQAEAPIMADGDVCEVPSLILTVQDWAGEGFTAVVVQTIDTDIFSAGEVLKVEMLPNISIETIQGGLLYVERRVPTADDFPAGTLIQVRFRTYSEEDNILRIESIRKKGD